MTQAELVFNHVVEGLFIHGMGERVTPALKNRLRAIGLDLDQRLRPSYQRSTWKLALALAAEEMYPDQPLEGAAKQMGALVARGFEFSVMGKAIIAFAAGIDPIATPGRPARSLRSSTTYVSADVVERSSTECEVRCTGLDLSPYFTAGLLEASLKFCRAKMPRVTVASQDGDAAVLKVVWENERTANG